MVGGNDYIDNHFYFVPRPMVITGKNGNPERISRVSCGSNFTVAVTDEGDAYSWGWSAFGVLGHGKGFFGQSALKIASLGQSQIDRCVARVCCGANHVVAMTSSSGNAWAKTFRQHLLQPVLPPPAPAAASRPLPSPSAYDPETFSDMEILDPVSGTVFPCHQVVLAARSAYFAGYLRAAARARTMSMEPAASRKEQVVLDCPAASVASIQHLLQYIYTDTLSAPAHKRKPLAELAEFVSIHRLADLCRHHGAYADRPSATAPLPPPSSFETDLLRMVKSDMFADCKFIVHALPEAEAAAHCEEQDARMTSEVVIFGHKLLFAKMPYFRSLFSSDFSDGHVDAADGLMVYDLAGFLSDGIDINAFERLIKYAYAGASSVLEVDDSGELMGLLVASNRVSLFRLTQLCEKKLSLHLNDYPDNVENCFLFAQSYNIPRLSRQCEELMHASSVKAS
jgi:hypothetical protein